MKYATINANGVTEIRQDGSTELPIGAILLTDEQHTQLCSGAFVLVNGEVVPFVPVPPDHNTQINEQIAAIEEANPITHRTMREFIIGVSTTIAATQGVTPAQLLNPADPHFSHAFAAFVGVNQETVALRAQKT